ncbi:putative proline permease [Aspergillus melleus]|uniref:putative proline permease n=1 Tax=Aspergillus melleus TaxID=138277 RepID=UPI001E8E68E5|nr:uncharacterized protein LDX57_002360 [Aspergillus melleus]KAH8424616.1 hypothetical protein LDX57_002360 [Aspergillus melleus]
MAVGPTLGTGLFIGSGQALAVGGPATLLAAYVFISLLVYCLTTAAAEIAAHMPVRDGTMLSHTYRYGSIHLGFALGYLRWYTLALLASFEIINAMVNLTLWEPGTRVTIRIAIVAGVIFLFNMLPERVFKRTEAFFTGVKLLTTIGLILLSIFLAARGIPGTSIRGFYYWRHPGAINRYLMPGYLGQILGLVQCVLYSTIMFIFSPELTVGRAETADMETGFNILRVAQIDNIHLCVLYILSALAVGVMSPSNEPLLTNYGAGAGMSPYVVGVRRSQVPTLPVVATTLIFFSSVASARSFLFMSSRTLCSLAEAGHAPALFKNRNGWGVPYASVMASAMFASFAFLSLRLSVSVVFNFLLYFITTSGYISWLCLCIVYLRFRRATKTQGFVCVHQTFIQPFGTYFAMLVCASLSLANILMTVVPARLTIRNPVAVYLGAITFLLLYIGHYAKASMAQVAASETVTMEHCRHPTENPHPSIPSL